MANEDKNTSNIREGHISVTGGNVWYKIAGANKNKTPVIILHGGPAATHYYLTPLEALCDERPIVFYDQLGCGKSDRNNDKALWTIESYTRELSKIIEFLGFEKVHLLGHSWGTMLAVDFVLNAKSNKVSSLILSGPCLSVKMWKVDQRKYLFELPDAIQETIERSERIGNFDSKEYREAMLNYYKLHMCRLDPWPDCLTKSFDEMNYGIYKYMWGPSEFTIMGTLKNYDQTAELHRIKLPALFTCGEFDEASPQTCNYYHKKLPDSEIFVFNETSHNHHLEKTEDYLRVVGDFLKRAES